MQRTVLVRLAAVLIFAATAASSSAQDADGLGSLLEPLPVRDQFLLSNGFFFFEPGSARVLPAGRWSIDLHIANANTFAKSAWVSRSLEGATPRRDPVETLADARFAYGDSAFLVDGETHRATLSLHRGFGANLELGASIPVSTVGGGWSDSIIERFHNALRLGNAQRESLRRNNETVYLRSPATTFIRERSAGAELGDIALNAKYELSGLEDRGVALSVEGAMELPTGHASTLDGSGSMDGGIQVLASHNYGNALLHVSLGILRLGGNKSLSTRPQLLITDTVGASHLITDLTAVTSQLTVSESPFRQTGIPELTRRSYQLTAGVQHRMGSAILYVGLIENLLNYDNSADVGMIWGISRRF